MNDRPYASSSMVAVALGQVFRTAMNGTSESFPELAASALPARDHGRGRAGSRPRHAGLVARLFEPLGWTVDETPIPLDRLPGVGRLGLRRPRAARRRPARDALRHLYVLLPVLDDAKHYWVSDDEVGKLLRAGEGWLPDHPERELITRALSRAPVASMVDDAQSQLLAADARRPT